MPSLIWALCQILFLCAYSFGLLFFGKEITPLCLREDNPFSVAMFCPCSFFIHQICFGLFCYHNSTQNIMSYYSKKQSKTDTRVSTIYGQTIYHWKALLAVCKRILKISESIPFKNKWDNSKNAKQTPNFCQHSIGCHPDMFFILNVCRCVYYIRFFVFLSVL